MSGRQLYGRRKLEQTLTQCIKNCLKRKEPIFIWHMPHIHVIIFQTLYKLKLGTLQVFIAFQYNIMLYLIVTLFAWVLWTGKGGVECYCSIFLCLQCLNTLFTGLLLKILDKSDELIKKLNVEFLIFLSVEKLKRSINRFEKHFLNVDSMLMPVSIINL